MISLLLNLFAKKHSDIPTNHQAEQTNDIILVSRDSNDKDSFFLTDEVKGMEFEPEFEEGVWFSKQACINFAEELFAAARAVTAREGKQPGETGSIACKFPSHIDFLKTKSFP